MVQQVGEAKGHCCGNPHAARWGGGGEEATQICFGGGVEEPNGTLPSTPLPLRCVLTTVVRDGIRANQARRCSSKLCFN